MGAHSFTEASSVEAPPFNAMDKLTFGGKPTSNTKAILSVNICPRMSAPVVVLEADAEVIGTEPDGTE